MEYGYREAMLVKLYHILSLNELHAGAGMDMMDDPCDYHGYALFPLFIVSGNTKTCSPYQNNFQPMISTRSESVGARE